MATLALNSGLWARPLLNSFVEGFTSDRKPFSGAVPHLKVKCGTCPEKPDHLNYSIKTNAPASQQMSFKSKLHRCMRYKPRKDPARILLTMF